MRAFFVIAKTAAGPEQFTRLANSSGEAAEQVASLYDEPCGITVQTACRSHTHSSCSVSNAFARPTRQTLDLAPIDPAHSSDRGISGTHPLAALSLRTAQEAPHGAGAPQFLPALRSAFSKPEFAPAI